MRSTTDRTSKRFNQNNYIYHKTTKLNNGKQYYSERIFIFLSSISRLFGSKCAWLFWEQLFCEHTKILTEYSVYGF